MRMRLPLTLLSSLISLGLAHAGATTDPGDAAAGPGEQKLWMVEFAEAGLSARLQQTPARRGGERIDVEAAPVRQHIRDLQSRQRNHKDRIAEVLGQPVDALQVTHHYLATHSGIALPLTAGQAAKLRRLPGIRDVVPDGVARINSFRGPSFIGAQHVWSGAATPDRLPADGRGMVIGVIDTGITAARDHPSFLNTAACGHDSRHPKVRSAVDCTRSSSSGRCTGTDPGDTDGHGTHVASVAAGNRVDARHDAELAGLLPARFDSIAGVAPCAAIRSYKACPDSEACPHSAIQASMNQLLLDGDVDVLNFSISGGSDPWDDNDRAKLELTRTGVLVAASAGNSREDDPEVVGRVGHRGPWVLSVAAASHDEAGYGRGSIVGPMLPPPIATENMLLIPGSTTLAMDPMHGVAVRHHRGHPVGAEGCFAFPQRFFEGAIAVMRRGDCTFTEKIGNAHTAGAIAVIVGNHEEGLVSMDTSGAPAIPAYSTSRTSGEELIQYISDEPLAMLDISGPQGDVLADFSYRGPTPGPLANLTKPDIAAPGVDLLGAGATERWMHMGGTSAASPHVAGVAALVRSVHPQWTAIQVKSALQLTASAQGQRWDGRAWNVDDVGSGRVDAAAAVRAGFVLEETHARFIAANPRGGGIDVRQLNLPSLRDVNCSPSCTWTRTVTGTLPFAANWTATVEAPRGFELQIVPKTFLLEPGASRQLTFTATPVTPAAGHAIRFGQVTFHTDADGDWPVLAMTAALRGTHQEGGSPFHPPAIVHPECVGAASASPQCQQARRIQRSALREACRQMRGEPLPDYCRN